MRSEQISLIQSPNKPKKGNVVRKICSILQIQEGILLGILAGTSNVSEQVIAKMLIKKIEPAELLLCRFSMQFVFTIILICVFKPKLMPAEGEYFWSLLRSILTFISFGSAYMSFKYILYMESLLLNYGTLCITSIVIGRFILLEKITSFLIVLMIIILAGVIVTCSPAISTEDGEEWPRLLYGYLWAFLAGLAFAFQSFSSKKLEKTSPISTSLHLSIFATIIAAFITISPLQHEIHLNMEVLEYSLAAGLLGTVITISWARALQHENIAEACIAVQIEIPFGSLLGFVVLNEVVKTETIIGECIIIFGILCMFIKHMVTAIQSKNEANQCYA